MPNEDGEPYLVGIDTEIPVVADGHDVWTSFGARQSGSTGVSVTNGHTHGGGPSRQELLIDDPVGIDEFAGWYRDAYHELEDIRGRELNPNGIVALRQDGSTQSARSSGGHLHFSPIGNHEMKLFEDALKDPAVQLVFCSSAAIHNDDRYAPISRYWRNGSGNGYGNLYDPWRRSYPGGHHELYAPDPLHYENMELAMEFVDELWNGDPTVAVAMAHEWVADRDARLTIVRRVEAMGGLDGTERWLSPPAALLVDNEEVGPVEPGIDTSEAEALVGTLQA